MRKLPKEGKLMEIEDDDRISPKTNIYIGYNISHPSSYWGMGEKMLNSKCVDLCRIYSINYCLDRKNLDLFNSWELLYLMGFLDVYRDKLLTEEANRIISKEEINRLKNIIKREYCSTNTYYLKGIKYFNTNKK